MSDPADDFHSFTFSLHVADATANDLELRMEALKTRIDHIVDNVTIDNPPPGMPKPLPILEYILRLNPDRDECEVLGKALARIAPLRQQYDELNRQMAMVKMVREDPKAVAALFGDFPSNDLDPEMFS